jgi:hypothetical protein
MPRLNPLKRPVLNNAHNAKKEGRNLFFASFATDISRRGIKRFRRLALTGIRVLVFAVISPLLGTIVALPLLPLHSDRQSS